MILYALVVAAGAMIFVAVEEELIPESQQNGNGDLATIRIKKGPSPAKARDG